MATVYGDGAAGRLRAAGRSTPAGRDDAADVRTPPQRRRWGGPTGADASCTVRPAPTMVDRDDRPR
ncbi:hypothetical protein GCM10023167_06610 [Brevibacterium pityocampae]|uniref:Uncharacterized protein n=1 Tax=Brevibacterium pityocampae TaxID=506594 RepID=A0ABP8J519_9MICO